MIRFYENRKIYFGISIAIILIGIITLFINGISLDIQFKGGAILKYAYNGEIDLNKVDGIVTNALAREVSTQITTDLVTQQNNLVLNLAGNKGLSVESQQKLEEALKNEFPDAGFVLSESSIVEPFIGKQFLRRGITAIVLASILIVVYVWIRFKRISGLSAGVMALVALFHDVLAVFITFIVFKIPLDENFIAVALTIIGYSINDTIVIYDRIRENSMLDRKIPIEDLVNKSITQSLTRSINTAIAVFFSIVLVYGFAQYYNIESIKNFALPMTVGVVSGCYSTICLAGPLWVMWQKHKQKSQKAA